MEAAKTRGELKAIARNLAISIKDYLLMQEVKDLAFHQKDYKENAEHLYQVLRDDLKLSDKENEYVDKKFAEYMIFDAKKLMRMGRDISINDKLED